LNSNSNPKSKPLHSGIKGKNIRRRHKRKSHDDYYESQINSVFNHLDKIQIRVETQDGESKTVSKYYQRAQHMLDYMYTTGIQNPFVISMSDLGPFLIMMLLDSHHKDYILYRVIERIFENCDSDLLRANKKSRYERYPWLIEM
jgi:hypothetical protein